MVLVDCRIAGTGKDQRRSELVDFTMNEIEDISNKYWNKFSSRPDIQYHIQIPNTVERLTEIIYNKFKEFENE